MYIQKIQNFHFWIEADILLLTVIIYTSGEADCIGGDH
jgi:hypothetical protein